ncbi:MAG TPA: hypothetical protein VFW41_06115 [Gaiellaceae bacterium]|nr:hypothetical protein [Gaiellaceae bacterium]
MNHPGNVVRARAVNSYLAGPLGAAGALLVFAVVLLDVFDVPPSQSLLFVGYQLGYVVVPGVAALLALTGSKRVGLNEIALGVGLGYALEVLAFAVCGASGEPGLFRVFPLAVVALSGPFLRAVRPRWSALREPSPSAWMLAWLIAVLAGFLANRILDTPLPTQVYALRGYATDMLWSTSVTADALHHWPVTIPGFAGRHLHYHVFAFFDMAGASRATGLGPWLVNFRFYPLWTVAVASFELYAAARVIARRASAGPLAVFLFFVAGSFLPWAQPRADLLGVVIISATFAFGLVVWVPTLLALRHVATGAELGWRRGSAYAIAAALTALSSGAKAPIPVVAGSGLALVAIWAIAKKRRPPGRVVATGLGVAAIFAVAWVVLYRAAGGGGGVTLKPFGTIKSLQPFELVSHHVPSPLLEVFWLLVAVVVAAKLIAVIAPGVFAAAAWRDRADVVFLSAMVVAGLVYFFAFTNAGESQRYFEWYGYAAGAILAGVGFSDLFHRTLRPGSVPTWALFAGALAAILLWTTEVPGEPTKSAWLNVGHGGGRPSAEYTGFRWIAAHTGAGDVLAVDARKTPTSCFQTAFAERRAMIDCAIGFAPERSVGSFADLRGVVSASLFAQMEDRVRLNDAIFDRGSASALAAAAARFHVRYVVVDLASGGTAGQVSLIRRIAKPVFENSAVVVFRVGSAA